MPPDPNSKLISAHVPVVLVAGTLLAGLWSYAAREVWISPAVVLTLAPLVLRPWPGIVR